MAKTITEFLNSLCGEITEAIENGNYPLARVKIETLNEFTIMLEREGNSIKKGIINKVE